MKKSVILFLVLALCLTSVAFAEETTRQLIYGSTTEISGDFAPSSWWTNNAMDKTLRDLVHGYSTVSTDQGGNLVVDSTVTKSIDIEVLDDGSKVYTITINDGLLYNNGEAITSADYVGYIALQCSAVAQELGMSFTTYKFIEGAADYRTGTASYISGVRMIDDTTFSVHILKEDTDGTTLFPYFYELDYANYAPINMRYWLGDVTVKDDGNGVYVEGLVTSAVSPVLEKARYTSDETVVSSGPYQFVEYNASAKQAVLKINPNFAGNFEGQKPSIEKLVFVKAEDATWANAMKTGDFNFYDTMTDGEIINAALDMIEDPAIANALGYNFDTVQFDRAGYGALFFMCDFGPTQFPAVRKAMAKLLDRVEFANTFCQGWGSVVSAPGGAGLWQWQASEEWLDENLNSYPYDYEGAVALLVEDGWIYNADGSAWTEGGLRYKKVTAEEAGTYAGNVTLADGTILMPLSMEWSSSEGNSVSELLKVMLAENPDVAKAGMKINQQVMSFAELLSYYYRDETVAEKYGVPTYCLFNLANGFNAPYSQAYEYTLDPEMVDGGWNSDRIYDETLDRLSMNMVYGLDADQIEEHLDMFCQLMKRWNELLPALPLYSNIYVTMYPDWLEGYTQDSFWDFQKAILYASIAE